MNITIVLYVSPPSILPHVQRAAGVSTASAECVTVRAVGACVVCGATINVIYRIFLVRHRMCTNLMPSIKISSHGEHSTIFMTTSSNTGRPFFLRFAQPVNLATLSMKVLAGWAGRHAWQSTSSGPPGPATPCPACTSVSHSSLGEDESRRHGDELSRRSCHHQEDQSRHTLQYRHEWFHWPHSALPLARGYCLLKNHHTKIVPICR